MPDYGQHNADLEKSQLRLVKGATYRDLSTVVLVPTRGLIHARVVMSWMSMVPLMNQKLVRLPPALIGRGMEVGDAYNQMVAAVLADPGLQKFKFILTLEEDNIPPPDGLHKLLETIHDGPWAAVGGLYWTKGEGGQPMIYGDPTELPVNFIPQVPKRDTVQECRGLGMGFTLFDVNLFRDPDLPTGHWFQTVEAASGTYTQDLFFFHRAVKLGYRFACDTRVRVGHYDVVEDKVW
jgi:hypothetical protein